MRERHLVRPLMHCSLLKTPIDYSSILRKMLNMGIKVAKSKDRKSYP